ncbi:MAG: ABC transporter ATP-binding protein [Candidatus Eremiobacteraeota bacterium]|nr:ABC transporter ATP-binding protein [Candidatus Eremiobacteraeota bacterium]MCL5054529.1 ABC transporter ATP-binding protein [Bacillota bacterium]
MSNSVIQAKNLNHHYDEIQALSQISCEIKENEMVGVIGPNGSGKSTFLKILAGILNPSSGEVFLKGENLKNYDKREKAKLISFIPQSFSYDFSFSVLEFIKMGRAPYLPFLGNLSAEDWQAVNSALHKSDCLELNSRKMTQLSGGEKQRVLLAQGFAQEPDLFILDEPVSHLDIGHQIQILTVLKKQIFENKTVVCSFHDLNLASLFSDRILLFSCGKLTASGAPEKVLTSEILQEIYRIPLKVLHDFHSKSPIVLPDLVQSQFEGSKKRP